MKKNMKNGFTLVELLAVIVILAIVLVIAVPKVMSVIEDSKKATLESTAKMIASSAEKAKVQNSVLGKDATITCDSVAKINKLDYEDCDIDFDDNTAKVTIKGSGKFAGLNICNGTKTEASATDEECSESTGSVEAGDFETDSWETIVRAVQQAYENGTEYPYNVGDEKTVNLGETLGTHTIRVSNKTKCNALETQTLSKSACGFVLEFADIITTHNMNDANNNDGGWPATKMRVYVNETIYESIPKDLRNGIIDTYVISGHNDVDDMTRYENVVEGNFYSIDKLYLLSATELTGDSSLSTAGDSTRQLDYYVNNGYEKDGTVKYWSLRTTQGYECFFVGIKDFSGKTGERLYPTSMGGVSPAFRLAN